MNDKMKRFIELAQVDFAQAMELMPYIPGAKEAILLHTFPGKNSNHRKFFSNAARDPETDPEILHSIGKRDLPTKIRFAVIDNPSTERRTIEKMARQTGNDAVTRRAEKFLQTNPESPKGNMMESRLKLSTKKIRQIIKEELYSIIKETMIKPSNLIQKILDDPKVNSKIKEKLKKLMKGNDEEGIMQGLQIVATYNPEYTEEIDSVIKDTLTPKYKQKFDSVFNRMPKDKILKILSKKLKERVNKYAKRSGIKEDGVYIKNIRGGDGVYALVRTENEKALVDLSKMLSRQGFKPDPIQVRNSFATDKSFYDLRIRVYVSNDLSLPEDPDDWFKVINSQKNK